VNADWPWDVLDMRPSGDVRAIRRAYAAALKSGDYDSDAGAFMALRDARDAAIEMAEAGEIDDFDVGLGGVEPTVTRHDPPPEPSLAGAEPEADLPEPDAPLPPPEPSTTSPWAAPELEARPLEDMYQALYDTLVAQLEGKHPFPRHPSAPDQLEAILNDPRLADISQHDNADSIIAEIVARTIPASDAIVMRASNYFGWPERADQIDAHPAIRFIKERQAMLTFWSEVQQPGHRLNRAWRFMISPPGKFFVPAWNGTKDRNELMQTIREHYPELESELNSERVGNWEAGNPVSRTSFSGWALGIWVALMLLNAIGRMAGTPSGSLPVEPPIILVSPESDIDSALNKMLGDQLPVHKLRSGNPSLYIELSDMWAIAKADNTSATMFDYQVAGRLSERVVRAFPRISFKTLQEQWRIRRDAVLAGAPRLPNRCAITRPITSFLQVPLPDDLMKRVRQNVAATLIEAKDPLPSLREYYSYSIPGTVMEDAAKRAKLPRAELDRVIGNPEESETKCKARMALVEATLAAPRSEALEVLRGM
jgi:hypothetical protein